MLPVLDGDFRVSLQGSPENELQLCLESGDPEVQTMEAADAVFINSGDNPFKLMKESIKLLSKIKGNFKHIEDKEVTLCRSLQIWTGLGGAPGMHFTRLLTQQGSRRALRDDGIRAEEARGNHQKYT
ncbi:probable galactinol--sucrose galactosyltransferase 1 isoform X2 [Setaria italica]|uniref:probable galactinol--sucrose galactosyltransferase 1 isoform X2 n=1 Tax=Setaria italica TaxID=4555 RepID=UPI0003509AC3|nr:probable galactinol--sucrose galactosyltransferase 1 isoform X2 [Setaria italica]